MKRILLTVVVLMFLQGVSFAQLPGEHAPILNMPLDNSSAEDISGNENHGIKHGALVVAEDRHGNPDGAMHFDGDKDFIVVPRSESYDIQNEYTISFWVKREFR